MTNPRAAVDPIMPFVEGQSLRCHLQRLPARATVFRWIARHKEFRDWYALAREFQARFRSEQ